MSKTLAQRPDDGDSDGDSKFLNRGSVTALIRSMDITREEDDGVNNSIVPVVAVDEDIQATTYIVLYNPPEEDDEGFDYYDDPYEDDVDISRSLVDLKWKHLSEMYDLYRRHGCVVGFSVHKSTTRWRNVEGVFKVSEKYFVCSCEGKADGRKRKPENEVVEGTKKRRKRTVPKTRTGCGATMRVQLMMDGMFEVVSHVIAHNHELTRSEWRHHHRYERSISESKAESIQLMTKSAMRTSIQYNYMVEGFGGEECLGHTKKDHYNFVNKLKVKQIEGGDAQNHFNMLQKEAEEDSKFFFRVKLDDMGRLCNMYWTDSMMKEDYRLYGDVVIFDTTYRTNRYNLICGAIVGVNNHWKNVMFGCAFVSDEKIESFEWLFEVFKESMVGVAPVTIFTDQDHAMSTALSKVTKICAGISVTITAKASVEARISELPT